MSGREVGQAVQVGVAVVVTEKGVADPRPEPGDHPRLVARLDTDRAVARAGAVGGAELGADNRAALGAIEAVLRGGADLVVGAPVGGAAADRAPTGPVHHRRRSMGEVEPSGAVKPPDGEDEPGDGEQAPGDHAAPPWVIVRWRVSPDGLHICPQSGHSAVRS